MVIQKRIFTLNNRLKVFEIIRQQQYDTANIQIHYQQIDTDRYFD